MPTSDDRAQWRGLAERAEAVCEAARHDPYDPQLAETMQALAGELAALRGGEAAGLASLDLEEIEPRAAAHAAAGEAWFALLDSKQALAEFNAALEVLGREGSRPPAGAAAQAQAQALCGRGKCLVALQRSAEAIAVLDASIGWCATQGDPYDEAQQSLLSQALHTLGLVHADAGDRERAVEAMARAVRLRRRLAERDAERHRLALSRSLRMHGDWLNERGRREEGHQAHAEMLELRRRQWQLKPTVAATLAFAQGADILATHYGSSISAELCLSYRQDAVAGYMDLHARYPANFAGDLARIFHLPP